MHSRLERVVPEHGAVVGVVGDDCAACFGALDGVKRRGARRFVR
ncbi:hypothetical protein SDC9_155271 [bioreactor metagenome]|uniref:Uncharacterized protein n=1 Tax=bioreactor metagenome TaxID=1076179 RepID=A0A645F120_9ZZZZ